MGPAKGKHDSIEQKTRLPSEMHAVAAAVAGAEKHRGHNWKSKFQIPNHRFFSFRRRRLLF
jgi:hypothetical protein